MPMTWACTACCQARFRAEKFEEATIGGLGLRTCAVCGVSKDRMDGMHLVHLPEASGSTRRCRFCGNAWEACHKPCRVAGDGLHSIVEVDG